MGTFGKIVAFVVLARLYAPVTAILATWAAILLAVGFVAGKCSA